MPYIIALLIASLFSGALLFTALQLRTIVDDRMEFLLATDQQAGDVELFVLQAASALADYGYLLVLPILILSLYVARRISRSARNRSPREARSIP